MGQQTGISWCDRTWSPWHGCAKVSDGCKNCYAEVLSRRNPGVLGIWGPGGTRVVSKSWDKPRAWDREAARGGVRLRVFPSICDPFEDRDDLVGPRRRFAKLIWDTPNLDWLLLTKRPEHAREMIYQMWFPDAEWPSNYWLGTSVESQAYTDRIWHLFQATRGVRFVSCEPLLGPVSLRPFLRSLERDGPDCDPGLDWVIVGGESGPRRRPMELTWLEDIVGQCRDAGVPCWVKQDSAARDGQQGRIPDELWSIKEFPRVGGHAS